MISWGFEASRTVNAKEGHGQGESHCGHRKDDAPWICFVEHSAHDGVRVGVVDLEMDVAEIEVLGCER